MAINVIITVDTSNSGIMTRILPLSSKTALNFGLKYFKKFFRRYVMDMNVNNCTPTSAGKHCLDIHMTMDGIDYEQIIQNALPILVKQNPSVAKLLDVIQEEQGTIIHTVLELIDKQKKDTLVCVAVQEYQEVICAAITKALQNYCKGIQIRGIDAESK